MSQTIDLRRSLGREVVVHIAKHPVNRRRAAANIRELVRNARKPALKGAGGMRIACGPTRITLPPIGASFPVRVTGETIGRVRACAEYVVVQDDKQYGVLLPESSDAVLSASDGSLAEWLRKRYENALKSVLPAMEEVGPVRMLPVDATGFVASASEVLAGDRTVKVRQLPALNALIASVPADRSDQFEAEMKSRNIEIEPISPLPIKVAYQPRRRAPDDPRVSTRPDLVEGSANEPPEPPGRDVRVGIIDTGFDPRDPDLADKDLHFAEFDEKGDIVGTRPYESDPDRHGTDVTRIVARAASRARISMALATPERLGTIEQICSAMDWLVYSEEVEVVNISFVTTDCCGLADYRASLRVIIRSLLRVAQEHPGLWIVAATGNHGHHGRLGCPGAYSDVLGVGAVDANHRFWERSGHGRVPQESNVYKPDYLAVGLRPDDHAAGRGAPATSFAAPEGLGLHRERSRSRPRRPGGARQGLLRPPDRPRPSFRHGATPAQRRRPRAASLSTRSACTPHRRARRCRFLLRVPQHGDRGRSAVQQGVHPDPIHTRKKCPPSLRPARICDL